MEEPLRYHRTFGLNAGQLDELEERIEEILPEPWDKGIGRPKSLSLREAIMVTLLYKRQHILSKNYLTGQGIRYRPGRDHRRNRARSRWPTAASRLPC